MMDYHKRLKRIKELQRQKLFYDIVSWITIWCLFVLTLYLAWMGGQ